MTNVKLVVFSMVLMAAVFALCTAKDEGLKCKVGMSEKPDLIVVGPDDGDVDNRKEVRCPIGHGCGKYTCKMKGDNGKVKAKAGGCFAPEQKDIACKANEDDCKKLAEIKGGVMDDFKCELEGGDKSGNNKGTKGSNDDKGGNNKGTKGKDNDDKGGGAYVAAPVNIYVFFSVMLVTMFIPCRTFFFHG